MNPNKYDIVEIIGSLVKLEKKGKDFIGLCPFHDDHNPSLRVTGEHYLHSSPYKKKCRIFKCFTCGEGGDIIHFIYLFFRCKTYKRARNILVGFIPRPYKERRVWVMPKSVDYDTEDYASNDFDFPF